MIKQFIPRYDHPEEPAVRLACGRFAGMLGIMANLLLFCVKVVLGILFSSISMIADSINNLSDAGSSILTFVGYAVSGRPADKDHPYGHARMEYLCGLFVSIIVTVLGIQMLISAVGRLTENSEPNPFTVPAMVIMASTILVKLMMALFYRRVGKHIDSQTLRAAATDSLSDVIATTAVIVGMLLTPITGPKTDGVIGLLIAVYIIIVGIRLVIETSQPLLGAPPDAEKLHALTAKIKSYDGVLGVHDLVMHDYGESCCFASVHVEMDADGDIMRNHDQIDNIEHDVEREMGIHLVIHLDPICLSDPRVNELRDMVSGLVSEVAQALGIPLSMHDFRVVFGPTHFNLLFDLVVAGETTVEDATLCTLISDRIRRENPTYNAVITVDRNYFSHRYGEEQD